MVTEMASASASAGEPVLSTRGLVKRFGALVAVDGLDLEVWPCTCVGLLGPNGAGKTTTVEILEGLQRPDGGEVRVLGLSWQQDADEIRQAIGVQLQVTEFYDKLTVFEVLRLFRALYVEGRDPEEVIDWVGLREKRDGRVATLSGGQKQRLALGCALISRPRLLFLDEPTTGLDPQARRRVWELVERFLSEGGTVLLTTHYMDEAERLCDQLVIVDEGRVVARGTPREMIARLGAESVVEFRPDPPQALTAERLAGLDGVREVRPGKELWTLVVTDTPLAIGGLFALAHECAARIEDLRTHRPTLEDVFVDLTGKHLRDG
jgi:ABC-2 type transport system ATP-binding protein